MTTFSNLSRHERRGSLAKLMIPRSLHCKVEAGLSLWSRPSHDRTTASTTAKACSHRKGGVPIQPPQPAGTPGRT